MARKPRKPLPVAPRPERDLPMLTIYRTDGYVGRVWIIRAGVSQPIATQIAVKGPTLESIRAHVPRGLICVPRSPSDDPVLVETWL